MYHIKKSFIPKAFLIKALAIFWCFALYSQSWSCIGVYTHHNVYPIATDLDGGGPNTWFNPMITGEIDGCALFFNAPSTTYFTLTAGQSSSHSIDNFYGVVGNSITTRQNYDAYNQVNPTGTSPMTQHYKTLCQSSAQQKNCQDYSLPGGDCCSYVSQCNPIYGSAPGICMIYTNDIISVFSSNCANQMSQDSKLSAIDTTGLPALPNLDSCVGTDYSSAQWAGKGCFPYPMPPSPPPFCDQVPVAPQAPAYLPVCTSDCSSNATECNVNVCGEPNPSSQPPTNYSTYLSPCARVTFNNYYCSSSNTNISTTPSSTPCSPPTTPPQMINGRLLQCPDTSTSCQGLNAGNYVEAIYTETVNSTTTPQITELTRFDSQAQSKTLPYYGYNNAQFQDICYNFSPTPSQTASNTATITDTSSNSRQFRTCLNNPPSCDGTNSPPCTCVGCTNSTSNPATCPSGCVPPVCIDSTNTNPSGCTPATSYCIEEITNISASGDTCVTTNPYCFPRPSLPKPTVTFCPSTGGCPGGETGGYCLNASTYGSQGSYCLQASLLDGSTPTTYTFWNTDTSLRSQDIYTVVETDNNYSLPTSDNLQLSNYYYDLNNTTYPGTYHGTSQNIAGLYYNNINSYPLLYQAYNTGATKFCLTGYSTTSSQDIVCGNSDPNITPCSSTTQTTPCICTTANAPAGCFCSSSITTNCVTPPASSQIQYRTLPAVPEISISETAPALPTNATTPNPLTLSSEECCNPYGTSPGTTSTCASPPVTPALFRVKNPIEEGLCVDIMPFTFVNCSNLTNTTADPTLITDCQNYVSYCHTLTSDYNGYVNLDICTKNFIYCMSTTPATSPPYQPTGINKASNVCQFYNNPTTGNS